MQITLFQEIIIFEHFWRTIFKLKRTHPSHEKMVNSETVWEGKSKSKRKSFSVSVSVFVFLRNQKIYFEKRHSWHRMCLFVFLSYLHNSPPIAWHFYLSVLFSNEWMLTFSWFTASFLLKWNQFCESKCCTYILLAGPCYFKSVCSLFSDIRNCDKIVSLIYSKL